MNTDFADWFELDAGAAIEEGHLDADKMIETFEHVDDSTARVRRSFALLSTFRNV